MKTTINPYAPYRPMAWLRYTDATSKVIVDGIGNEDAIVPFLESYSWAESTSGSRYPAAFAHSSEAIAGGYKWKMNCSMYTREECFQKYGQRAWFRAEEKLGRLLYIPRIVPGVGYVKELMLSGGDEEAQLIDDCRKVEDYRHSFSDEEFHGKAAEIDPEELTGNESPFMFGAMRKIGLDDAAAERVQTMQGDTTGSLQGQRGGGPIGRMQEFLGLSDRFQTLFT